MFKLNNELARTTHESGATSTFFISENIGVDRLDGGDIDKIHALLVDICQEMDFNCFENIDQDAAKQIGVLSGPVTWSLVVDVYQNLILNTFYNLVEKNFGELASAYIDITTLGLMVGSEKISHKQSFFDSMESFELHQRILDQSCLEQRQVLSNPEGYQSFLKVSDVVFGLNEEQLKDMESMVCDQEQCLSNETFQKLQTLAPTLSTKDLLQVLASLVQTKGLLLRQGL